MHITVLDVALCKPYCKFTVCFVISIWDHSKSAVNWWNQDIMLWVKFRLWVAEMFQDQVVGNRCFQSYYLLLPHKRHVILMLWSSYGSWRWRKNLLAIYHFLLSENQIWWKPWKRDLTGDLGERHTAMSSSLLDLRILNVSFASSFAYILHHSVFFKLFSLFLFSCVYFKIL